MSQEEQGERSQGVQSLETGLALFQTLATHQKPLALSDLARLAGMHRAKAHRYLVSLVRAGWVTQDRDSGLYDLGSRVRDLALSWLARQDSLELATAEARDLALGVAETCFVAVRSSGGATAVRVFQSPRAVSIGINEGAVFDPLSSATGRVFSTWDVTPDLDPPATMTREIRRRGYAIVEGDYVPGINAISAPVFDAQGHLALALTLVGPAASLKADMNASGVRMLQAACRRVSAALGWREAEASARGLA